MRRTDRGVCIKWAAQRSRARPREHNGLQVRPPRGRNRGIIPRMRRTCDQDVNAQRRRPRGCQQISRVARNNSNLVPSETSPRNIFDSGVNPQSDAVQARFLSSRSQRMILPSDTPRIVLQTRLAGTHDRISWAANWRARANFRPGTSIPAASTYLHLIRVPEPRTLVLRGLRVKTLADANLARQNAS